LANGYQSASVNNFLLRTVQVPAPISVPRRPSGHPQTVTRSSLPVAVAAINATLFETLNFNFIRDTAPIASVVRVPQVMQVTPSLPVRGVTEFIAYAKANPGRIAMGSGGNGSPAHVIGEYFKLMTGTDLTHVPYRGAAPAVTDLLGGQIQVTFTEMATSLGYIRAGKLRALAVTTATRSEALPDIPALSEFLPGFEASQWIGLVAPRDTPSEITGKLNIEINAALGDPRMKARFADIGGMVLPGLPADFGKLIRDDTEKWANVIRAAKIKLD
jgi:tripartite-type tricarboxylate transporter receptor subunit TctC